MKFSAVLAASGFFLSTVLAETPGAAGYNCHAQCRGVIAGSREDNYCSDVAWKKLYDNCIACSDSSTIRRYYSEGVILAVEPCKLGIGAFVRPTPPPVFVPNAESLSVEKIASTMTESGDEQPTAPAASSSAETTAASVTATDSSLVARAVLATGTGVSTTTQPSNTQSGSQPTSTAPFTDSAIQGVTVSSLAFVAAVAAFFL